MWRTRWQEAEATRKDFNFVLTRSGQEILCLRALQCHSGRNSIDPELKDNVLIANNFFEYINHIGCAVSVHYITNSGLIAGGQYSSRKDRQYSLRLWIPWTRITKIRKSLTWPNHVLHHTSKRSGKDTRIRCIGSIFSLLKENDWSSIKLDVMQSSFTIHSQLIVSRKLLWWNLKKSYTRSYMCHLDHHRKCLTKIIGCVIWIQKSLEAARTPNESNQNPKPNFQEPRDPVGGQESTQVEKLDMDFRVPGLSHAVVKEAEIFRVQELVKKDRESSSSRSTSRRLAEWRLQPIQQQLEGDDLRIGQCRVIRVVRNNTKSTMFSLSSLLESRNWLLHLRTALGCQRIQKKV